MDEYATFMHKPLLIIIGVVTIALGGASAEEQAGYGLGRPATDEEIRAWNIDVSPTGEGLPPGQGTAKQGAQIYAGKCAACHGLTGVEGPKDRLVGGRNTLTTQKPIKTIGMHEVTIRLHPEVALKITLNVARSPDEAERQAKGENVIASLQAAQREQASEQAQELSAAAAAAAAERGPAEG